MDELIAAMHRAAGRAYGYAKTCMDKGKFRSYDAARQLAEGMSTNNNPVEAFPCVYCESWHVGRTLTPEEGARFLVTALGIEV
jgi:hypothetical protein